MSSNGHRLSGIRWDDVQFERGYDKGQAYGQAKTANALFVVQLDALGRDSGVRAFSLHPGVILTALGRHVPTEEMIAAGWIDEDGNPTGSSRRMYVSAHAFVQAPGGRPSAGRRAGCWM